jgi:uncharacterized protein
MNSDIIVSDWAVLEVSSIISLRTRIGASSDGKTSVALSSFDSWRVKSALSVTLEGADIANATRIVRNSQLALAGPDALHLVIAQRLDATLLTFDKGLAKAARPIGLALAN